MTDEIRGTVSGRYCGPGIRFAVSSGTTHFRSKPMKTAFDLARWFQGPRDVSSATPACDEKREETLSECYKASKAAVSGSEILFRVSDGVVSAVCDPGSEVVQFTRVYDDSWDIISFWMNKSSVRDLGALVRSRAIPRVDIDNILFSEE